jgi:hypothetical protein
VVRLIVEVLVEEVAEHQAVVEEDSRAPTAGRGPRQQAVGGADGEALGELDVEAVERAGVGVVREVDAVAVQLRVVNARLAVEEPAVDRILDEAPG